MCGYSENNKKLPPSVMALSVFPSFLCGLFGFLFCKIISYMLKNTFFNSRFFSFLLLIFVSSFIGIGIGWFISCKMKQCGCYNKKFIFIFAVLYCFFAHLFFEFCLYVNFYFLCCNKPEDVVLHLKCFNFIGTFVSRFDYSPFNFDYFEWHILGHNPIDKIMLDYFLMPILRCYELISSGYVFFAYKNRIWEYRLFNLPELYINLPALINIQARLLSALYSCYIAWRYINNKLR